ncbi:MAG: RtcB family protein [Gemmatimonadetes bacterium]|nr:RtcB family protein [Gemmatimonadota bacterium]
MTGPARRNVACNGSREHVGRKKNRKSSRSTPNDATAKNVVPVLDVPKPAPVWGRDLIDPAAITQMENAMRLPVTIAGALMPDAHVGYGIPIGGVVALDNAVAPYMVGVDIACRVHMSIFADEHLDLIENGGRLWLVGHDRQAEQAGGERIRSAGNEPRREYGIGVEQQQQHQPRLGLAAAVDGGGAGG